MLGRLEDGLQVARVWLDRDGEADGVTSAGS